MSLKKVDHSVYFEAEFNPVLKAVAESRGLTVREYIERLVREDVHRTIHASTLVTKAAVFSGLVQFGAVSGGVPPLEVVNGGLGRLK